MLCSVREGEGRELGRLIITGGGVGCPGVHQAGGGGYVMHIRGGRPVPEAFEVLREEWDLAQWSRQKGVLGKDTARAKLGSGLRGA